MAVEVETLSSSEAQRLHRAVDYVSRQWLPLNPKVFASVKSGLKEGRYDLGSEFLVADLKKDIGLFSFCLKDLVGSLRKGGSDTRLDNPQSLFERATKQELVALLDRAEKALNAHSLSSLSDAQSAHLRYTLVSASAAETLAMQKTLQGDTAFLTALFRQLGLLLIAWNYPTVFSRAQRALLEAKETDERALERELGVLLGFSPELLGASVLEPFNLTLELSNAIEGEGAASAKHGDSARTAEEIAELCRVGEALARANDPEHYPQSAHSWGEAKSVIHSILGEDGLRRVQDTYDNYSASYREAGSKLLGAKAVIDPDQHKARYDQAATRERNPHIDACPVHLKQRLREFYAWRTPERNPQEAVAYLLREVVPVS
jgi:hypothetical protein